MTYEVQQTRWDRIIRRVSNSIGPGSRVSETLSELFPVLDVELVPGELLRLGGTQLCFGGTSISGAAGTAGRAVIFNPAGSGQLVTISQINFGVSGDSSIRWGITLAEQTVIATQRFRDTRDLLPSLPVARISQVAEVALANGTGQTRAAANVGQQLHDPNGIVVLAPGTGFEIGPGVNNLAFNVCFWWRERPAEESELSL